MTLAWLDEHLAAAHVAASRRPAYDLARTEFWTSGIAYSSAQAFQTSAPDRVFGAKLQPFLDADFRIGTELARSSYDPRIVTSKALWEAVWSRDWQDFGGLKLGFSASGLVDNIQAVYSQSVNGSLDIPMDGLGPRWHTTVRLLPSMSLDTSSGALSTSLVSEIVGERVLSSPVDPFTSVLNVRFGYGFAPDAQPVASTRLELRISPNL